MPAPDVATLIEANLHRGPHAWGIALRMPSGEVFAHKTTGAVVRYVDLICELTQNARAWVLHLRKATVGDPDDPGAAHPFPCGASDDEPEFVCHNGTASETSRLARLVGLGSDATDSQAIAAAVQKYRRTYCPEVALVQALELATRYTLRRLRGHAAVLLRRDQIVAASTGRTLFCRASERASVLCSVVPEGWEGQWNDLRSVRSITLWIP